MHKEDIIKIIFGIKLKHFREKKKISPQVLSEKTNISKSYLNEIEKGKKYPKADKIAAIADALAISYDDLISIKLPKEYYTLEIILKSNLIQELPLDLLGLDVTSIINLLSNSPTKLNAFINTIIEIARNHDLESEYFYFSVLRSYQELQENYFEEVENAVLQFREQFAIDENTNIDINTLKTILTNQYNCQFAILPKHLSSLRSIFKANEQKLYINEKLNDSQILFVLGREIAFQYLKLTPRPYTTTFFNNAGFNEIFNNFIASYFATSLLIPQNRIVKELKNFFGNKKWSTKKFEQMVTSFGVSAEMYMHRLTTILPKFFNLKSLFFLRLSHPVDKDNYNITKELHLGKLHNPHASSKNLHYCRRWVSISILKELEKTNKSNHQEDISLIQAQISNYIDSDNAYFIISMARPMYPIIGYHTSVSVGIKVNANFKKIVAFHNDNTIPIKDVNENCEMCSLTNCKDRVAPALLLQERQRLTKFSNELTDFLKK